MESLKDNLMKMVMEPLFWAVFMLILLCIPGANEILEYERNSILYGQIWRLYTGHLVHWNFDHLLWDLVTFVVLARLLVQENRRLFLKVMIFSPWIISMFLWFLEAEMGRYRGISGVDCTLFMALALCLLQDKRHLERFAGIGMILFGAGKVLVELVTGTAIFASSTDFYPVVLAHISGFVIGVVFMKININRKIS